MHYPVAAESVGQEEPRHSGRWAQDGMMVRRHLVEARPGALGIYREILKQGDTVSRAGQNLFYECGLEIGFVAGRLFGIVPGQEKSQTFGPEVKSVRHVDDHGCAMRKLIERLRWEDRKSVV